CSAPPPRAGAPAPRGPGLRPPRARPRPRAGDDDPPVRAPGPARQHRLRPPASPRGEGVLRLGLLPGTVPAATGRPPGAAAAARRDLRTPERYGGPVARPPHLARRRHGREPARPPGVAARLRAADQPGRRLRLPGRSGAGPVPRRYRTAPALPHGAAALARDGARRPDPPGAAPR